MDTLRTTFGRYKKNPPSGSGARKFSARIKWIMAQLQFLTPYIRHRETTCTLDEEDDSDNQVTEEEEVVQYISEESDDNTPLSTIKEGERKKKTLNATVVISDTNSQIEEHNDSEPDTVEPGTSTGEQKKSRVDVTSTKKPLPRKTIPVTTPKQTPKKSGKNKGKRNISPEVEQCSNVLQSVSNTLEDFGKNLLNVTKEPKKIKDEISVCVEGIEVKLRTIKHREIRLRMIDALERLAFKFLMEDYLLDEVAMKPKPATVYTVQTGYNPSVGYCTPAVQPVSPPHQYYQPTCTATTQQYMSALTALAANVQAGTTTTNQQLISSVYAAGDIPQSAKSTPTCLGISTSSVNTVPVTTTVNTLSIINTGDVGQSTIDASDILQVPSGVGGNLLNMQNSQIF